MGETGELPYFRLGTRQVEVGVVVEVAGELDMAHAGEFAAGVRDQLTKGPVLLDLSELSFMDSSGVGALDGLLRVAEENGFQLRIQSDLHENVKRVLDLTGMLAGLPLEDRHQRETT